jgi:hypothetical protein
MKRSTALMLAAAGSAAAFAPAAMPALRRSRPAACSIHMGKEAADGVFTPIVKAAKVVLGEGTLTKVRGDVIAKHSQVYRKARQPALHHPMIACLHSIVIHGLWCARSSLRSATRGNPPSGRLP